MMTDDELAAFMGIARAKDRNRILAAVTPAERATYEEMHRVEVEAAAYLAGTGPKPAGVIICTRRKR